MDRIRTIQEYHPELTEDGIRLMLCAKYAELLNMPKLVTEAQVQGLLQAYVWRLTKTDRDELLALEKELI